MRSLSDTFVSPSEVLAESAVNAVSWPPKRIRAMELENDIGDSSDSLSLNARSPQSAEHVQSVLFFLIHRMLQTPDPTPGHIFRIL
jgi:hypothetical protein